MSSPSPSAAIEELRRFLMEQPRVDDAAFVTALVERFASVGLPVWRISYALMTKHPEVLWRTVQWQEGKGAVVHDQPHSRLDTEFYKRSAVAQVRRTQEAVRVRLEPGDLPFPICADLRDEGATDYAVIPLGFTNGQVTYVSFATTEPNGFSDDFMHVLDAVRSFLARRLELDSSYYATAGLLDVYLGKNAARRVLAGQFQRGRGELIDAAIWFSDMRDFTSLTDGAPPAEVVAMLDAYFDAVATAVAEHGGEVLKFIGDAVLAIFPIDGNATAACRHALAAAHESLAALSRMNQTRTGAPIKIGIGLHRGSVMYGNIGARDRLDFTVISAAVNEASRLESLCKSLGTPLALSGAFVEAAGADDIVDLGEHSLKGVKAKLRVFSSRSLP